MMRPFHLGDDIFFRLLSFVEGELPEKEAVIEVLSGNLQREALADQRKNEEPADHQDNDCNDDRVYTGLGRIPFHAIPSSLPE
jgi:hypothetical protein